jgi:probable phosphomutase (TIGR03848 family)
MPLLLLIRHGQNDYVKKGRMAGRQPGVHLNERGQTEAAELAQALAEAPIKAVYSSPLERAVETAEPIAQAKGLEVQLRPGLLEADIGKWQNKSIKSLRRQKVWQIVQSAPSRMRFPEGESFLETQMRLVEEIEAICTNHKPDDLIALVFHSDPIKLVVTYYLGLPLDNFQRLAVDTGSVTILHLGRTNAHLIKLNQKPPFQLPFSRKKGRKTK